MTSNSKQIRILVLLVSAWLTTSAAKCIPSFNGEEIVIFHTNDVHSHLEAEDTDSEKNPYGLGGVARLKTLFDQQSAANANHLLVDAGDWSEGSQFFWADGGSDMLRLFDEIGYDAAVVGNHDHFLGPSETANIIERARPRIKTLGSNVDFSAPALDQDRARIQSLIQPFTIKTLPNGIRVGIIGAMCFDINYEGYFKPGIILDPVKTVMDTAKTLRSGPNPVDVVIVLSHNSFDYNAGTLAKVPGVNAIISGHSHVKTPKAVVVTNEGTDVAVVETGQWGQFLGQLKLKVDKNRPLPTGAPQVRISGYDLLPISSDLPADPKIYSFVQNERALLLKRFGDGFFDKVVANVTGEFVHEDTRETPLANLLTDAYRFAAKSQIAFEINSLSSIGLTSGVATTYDILGVQPHIFAPIPGKPFPQEGRSWTLKRMKMPGWMVRLLTNAILKKAGGSSDIWLSVSGIKVMYSFAKQGSEGILPIQSISLIDSVTGAATPLDDSATYTVAMHDGLTYALGVLQNIVTPPIQLPTEVEETGIEAWTALYNYMAEAKTLNPIDFQAGRYISAEADLMIQQQLIHMTSTGGLKDTKVLEAEVWNVGSVRSSGLATLKVYKSAVNDAVNDHTPNFENELVDEFAIPALDPGTSTHIRIATADSKAFKATGVYSVKFVIDGKDGNPTNNVTKKHVRF